MREACEWGEPMGRKADTRGPIPATQRKNVGMRRGRGPQSPRQITMPGCQKEQCDSYWWNEQSCSSLNGAGNVGDAMKTRCDYCCAPFGLLRRRYFNYQFCCEACEEAHKEQRSKMIAEFRSGLSHSLANSQ